jgi:proteasome alpha subunit
VEPTSIEKIFKLDDHIGCATSGLVADARSLVDRARLESQINRITYDEPIAVSSLVKKICDFKQSYTQYGGVRPFGTALLVAGVDENVPHLFETDPSGALMEYKASSVGSGRNQAMEVFEEKFKEGASQEEAVVLGLQALYKATDGKLNADAIEVGVVSTKENFRKFSMDEVKRYVDRVVGSK